MFVVGAGLSTLETGADNFLAICGTPRYSEIRLNLAQGIQGVGSFVAPLLASRVFFAKTIDDKQGLKNVPWVYLGVACFVALLIILFYFARTYGPRTQPMSCFGTRKMLHVLDRKTSHTPHPGNAC